ncbi:flagellar motor protein MotB [Ferrimonas balearica]|uniref:flagellar motor protein MotB n=1 Tax=Ferrimonas balearica TaxID=44012 RepID=UPI001C9558C0|nr:flagellar motor protein MotB [Ferrimonas balearica]MBY5980705.1 OmpA family protein [Ferrimonas balearica]
MAGHEVVVVRSRSLGGKRAKAGGAWKVAFADFTLAMMALFLVLWLVQVADKQERASIVQALTGETLLESSSGGSWDSNRPHILELDGTLSMTEAVMPATGTGVQRAGPAMVNQIPKGERGASAGQGDTLTSLLPGPVETQAQLEVLAREAGKIIAQSEIADNVAIQVVPQGLKILIRDNLQQFMFARGSSRMTPYFEDLLFSLAPLLKQVQNPLMVSGHTDSTHFRSNDSSNWELSSERALEARRALEFGGVGRNQFFNVVGMADQVPVEPSDPRSSANRRIELMVLTHKAEGELRGLFGVPDGKPVPVAQQGAEANQPRGRYAEVSQ